MAYRLTGLSMVQSKQKIILICSALTTYDWPFSSTYKRKNFHLQFLLGLAMAVTTDTSAAVVLKEQQQ